jgi:hypothetical protein
MNDPLHTGLVTRFWPWQADPRARQAIAALWAADPDPARTLAIPAQIQAALATGPNQLHLDPASRRGHARRCSAIDWFPIRVLMIRSGGSV